METHAGLEKLLKKEVPVSILRGKYALQEIEAQLKELRKIEPTGPAADAVELLVREQEKLSKDILAGVLVPLTEQDVWEIRFSFTRLFHFLSTLKAQGNYQGLGEVSADASIQMLTNQHEVAKSVQCALKTADGMKRLLTDNDLTRLDWRVLRDIWQTYAREFILSEDERKKS